MWPTLLLSGGVSLQRVKLASKRNKKMPKGILPSSIRSQASYLLDAVTTEVNNEIMII